MQSIKPKGDRVAKASAGIQISALSLHEKVVLSLEEFLGYASSNQHNFTSATNLVSADGYKSGIHRFCVVRAVHSSADGESIPFDIRIDRRMGKRWSRLSSLIGKSDRKDEVVICRNRARLLEDPDREAEAVLSFPQPLSISKLVETLRIISEEMLSYDVKKENCWALVSFVLEFLQRHGNGQFSRHPGTTWANFAPEARGRIYARLFLEQEATTSASDEASSVTLDAHIPLPTMAKISTHSNAAMGEAYIRPQTISLKSRPTPSPRFVGRTEVLKRLTEFFAFGTRDTLEESCIMALYAQGGFGKTQICAKVAETAEDLMPVYWIDASSPNNLEASFIALADLPSAKKMSIEANHLGVRSWLSAQKGAYLLVFDGADVEPSILRPYLPHSKAKRILISSRLSTMADIADDSMEIDCLDEDAALSLLMKSSRRHDKSGEQPAAVTIVRELGCLALAVDLAGKAIAEGCSFEDYLDMFNTERQALLGSSTLRDASGYDQTVYAAWEVSFNTLSKYSGPETLDAIMLLKIFGLLHNVDIMQDTFQHAAVSQSEQDDGAASLPDPLKRFLMLDDKKAWRQLHFRNALAILIKFSFISSASVNGSYSMHRLLHTWGRDRMALEERQEMCQSVTLLLEHSINKDMFDNAHAYTRRVLPHLEACRKHMEETKTNLSISQSVMFAGLYHAAGQYCNAAELYSAIVETQISRLGDRHPDTLTILANLAICYRLLGRLGEAKELAVAVWEALKETLGDRHPQTLTEKGNLAVTLKELGHLEDAKQLQVEALHAQTELLGNQHPATLTSMNNLALIYLALGRLSEAEELQRQVLRAQQDMLGIRHPHTLSATGNLSYTYAQTGRLDEANELELTVLETRKRLLGEQHPDTLTSMANLALIHRAHGSLHEAEELEVQVLETFTSLYGTCHPDTLRAMGNLAYTFQQLGRLEEAKELQITVLRARQTLIGEQQPSAMLPIDKLTVTHSSLDWLSEADKVEAHAPGEQRDPPGHQHPDTLIAMGNLASTYRQLGCLDEARELQIAALKAQCTQLGKQHPDTLATMSNLAMTYSALGCLSQTEELEVQILEARRQLLGDQHRDTLTAMVNLAYTTHELGRLSEAEKLLSTALEIQLSFLGERHPETLTSKLNLGAVYCALGCLQEGKDLEEQVVEARIELFGKQHPHTLSAMANLAQTYQQMGLLKEAKELQIKVSDLQREKLGERHPHTLISMGNLALTYSALGCMDEAEELEVQVLEARRDCCGDQHPATLTAMANLASTYRNLDRLRESEELLVAALRGREELLGARHPDTLTSMAGLALTYYRLDRFGEAEELLVTVLPLQKEVLGEQHSDTTMTMRNLAATYRELGRVVEAEDLELARLTLADSTPDDAADSAGA